MKYSLIFAVTCMVIFDFLAFFLSFLIALFIFPFELCNTMWWIPLLGCTFFLLNKSYVKHLSFLQESVGILKIASEAFMLGFIILFFEITTSTKVGLALAWLNALYLMPVVRYVGKTGLIKGHLWERRIVILGTGKVGQSIAKVLDQESILGYRILGFLTDEEDKLNHTVRLPSGKEIPVLGAVEAAEEIVRNKKNPGIIMAAPDFNAGACSRLSCQLEMVVPSFLLVWDLTGINVYGETRNFIREPWLALQVGTNPVRDTVLKRFFDLLIGGVAFLVSLPFWVIIAIIQKLEYPGPIFYTHTRVGRDGQLFKCWKFRTMCVNAEEVLNQLLSENPGRKKEWEDIGKIIDDPRVTGIGRFLRKTSLDELPQLINVLRGEMSLVGPRPFSPRWLDKYGESMAGNLQVRPGITGLWQVSGRADIKFSERIQLDNLYIQNWSIWLDIIIIFKTVIIVLNRRGAY